MIHIDKDIPPPPPRAKPDQCVSYSFGVMEVGHSFAVPNNLGGNTRANRIASAASQYAKRHQGKRFQVATSQDGQTVRCWRIA